MIIVIDKFFDLDLRSAKDCLQCYKRFLANTEEIVRFTNNHQFIKAFQLSLNEFHNRVSDTKMLKSMEEYIRLLETQNNDFEIAPLDIKLNELVFEQLEEDYARISNTWETKNIAEEVAKEYALKQQNRNAEDIENDPEQAEESQIQENEGTIKDPRPSSSSVQSNQASLSPGNYNIERVGVQSLPARLESSPPRRQNDSLRSENLSSDIGSDDASPWIAAKGKLNESDTAIFVSFMQLLKLDEKDEYFDNWKNFYSFDFIDAFESLYKEYIIDAERNRKTIEGFGEPIGAVKPRDDRMENLFAAKFNDFDVALFEAYKNTYSKEYQEENTTSRTEMIWKAATSFFKRS